MTAIVSELTRRAVRNEVSMTGEITLQGKVLPVGGIKEKVLAAKRLGIKEIILPRQNDKDVKEDLSEELRKGLTIHLVSTIDEVLLEVVAPRGAVGGLRRCRCRCRCRCRSRCRTHRAGAGKIQA